MRFMRLVLIFYRRYFILHWFLGVTIRPAGRKCYSDRQGTPVMPQHLVLLLLSSTLFLWSWSFCSSSKLWIANDSVLVLWSAIGHVSHTEKVIQNSSLTIIIENTTTLALFVIEDKASLPFDFGTASCVSFFYLDGWLWLLSYSFT